MKLVVFSDVHGNKTILERIISFNPDTDYFLSLGDTEVTMDYLLDLDIIGVKGNYPRDPGTGYEHMLTLNGVKIMMTHGHKYGVQKDLRKLMKKAFQNDVNVVLYGHTHIAKVDVANGLLLINPGSVYRPRSSEEPSYVILEINEKGGIEYTLRAAETNQVLVKKTLR